MSAAGNKDETLPAHRRHPRHWRENRYVYPVISRRSGGLSIGINLNPDKACNFDCVYCQVDRTVPPLVRKVDPNVMRDELSRLLKIAVDGSLFEDPTFAAVPDTWRRIHDIAFSGDGEPTTCPQFLECVELAAVVKSEFDLDKVRILLITDACYLTKPEVVAALTVMDANHGQIWAKLDAGTEAYYQKVNRPNYPLDHVIDNIATAAKPRAVVIQSLFMRLADQGPDDAEIGAYADRLDEILRRGGQIDHVQIYTVARRPMDRSVTALESNELDHIAEITRSRTGLEVRIYPGDA